MSEFGLDEAIFVSVATLIILGIIGPRWWREFKKRSASAPPEVEPSSDDAGSGKPQ